MNIRTKSSQSLRSRLHVARPTTQTVVVPAQSTEDADAYTWAVNAAIESGDTGSAYEIAANYRP